MGSAGIKPNVRTYTALITALGNASEWDRALGLLRRMRACSAPGGVEPNAYTYSALIKALGEQVTVPVHAFAACIPQVSVDHNLGEDLAQKLTRGLRCPCSLAIQQLIPHYNKRVETGCCCCSRSCMAVQGQWRLAEELFAELEAEIVSCCPPVVDGHASLQQAAVGSNPWGSDQGTAREMLASFSRTFRCHGDAAGTAPADGGSADESGLSAQLSQMGLGLSDSSASHGRPFDPLQPYGLLPSSLTQQVWPVPFSAPHSCVAPVLSSSLFAASEPRMPATQRVLTPACAHAGSDAVRGRPCRRAARRAARSEQLRRN